MSSKKEAVRRIIIFCIIAFVPLWIIVPLVNSFYDEPLYVCEEASAAVYVMSMGMFLPAIAAVLTRLITKEGMNNSYLGINFRGHEKYYIVSILLKPAESLVTVLVLWRVFMGDLSFREAFTAGTGGSNIAAAILQLALSAILFLPAFGEESGWRAYLMPELMTLMSKPAAIIAGGIIWGLWHAPLTIAGHNFGVDYPGFPVLGILLMCVYCTFMNMLLTFLTERTKSVYPASICHMINNNLSAGVMLMLFCTERAAEKINNVSSFNAFLLYLPAVVITGSISLALFLKDGKKARTAHNLTKSG